MSSVIVSRYLASELARIGVDMSMVEPLLPDTIKDMATKIGHQNAMQVVSKVGGGTLCVPVPTSEREDSTEARRKLDEALGSESLGRLIRKHYGGVILYT